MNRDKREYRCARRGIGGQQPPPVEPVKRPAGRQPADRDRRRIADRQRRDARVRRGERERDQRDPARRVACGRDRGAQPDPAESR